MLTFSGIVLVVFVMAMLRGVFRWRVASTGIGRVMLRWEEVQWSALMVGIHGVWAITIVSVLMVRILTVVWVFSVRHMLWVVGVSRGPTPVGRWGIAWMVVQATEAPRWSIIVPIWPIPCRGWVVTGSIKVLRWMKWCVFSSRTNCCSTRIVA